MSYNNFIYINDKIFEITNRKSSDMKFQTKVERSLNGTLKIDVTGSIKKKLSFDFFMDDRQLLRLYNIWSLNQSLSLTDYDGTNLSCACVTSNFEPIPQTKEITNNCYTITLEFEQI